MHALQNQISPSGNTGQKQQSSMRLISLLISVIQLSSDTVTDTTTEGKPRQKKMQIFINTTPEGLKEWAIIELQGDLESRNQESMAGKVVGDLHFTKDGTPFLIIGHHILYGKVQKLGKPFAVLEKVHKADPSNVDGGGQTTEYVVKSLIYKKLSFTDRPKPLVSAKAVTKKSGDK